MNFQPMVKCPVCGHANHPEISGWGGSFNTRTKECRKCGAEYTLVVYTEATLERDISLDIVSLRSKIDHYRKRVYELRTKLVNKAAEWAKEYIRVKAGTGGNQN